ncbi:class F sortase [Acaricomes phytoseiuli]|uniref:class F sortase n=1 Tax=Acaricomes phytoseiuli TaxID=291968 RepID=UPI002223035B|nr:class F sortase [Acaricomes phytoseiuli]MCW1250625.1 class F sortase [Acaricomes phytoseiuli]
MFLVAGLSQSTAGPVYAPAPTADGFRVAPSQIPTTDPVPSQVPAGRVVIPSVGIDQPIQAEALTPDATGSMVPPTAAAALVGGTAELSASEGSSVLAGHVNTVTNGPGPFATLASVSAGAVVSTTLPDGSRTDWRVVSAETLPKDGLPAALFDPAGPHQLVLVTCGGPVTGTVPGTNLPSYDYNVVVIATPIEG